MKKCFSLFISVLFIFLSIGNVYGDEIPIAKVLLVKECETVPEYLYSSVMESDSYNEAAHLLEDGAAFVLDGKSFFALGEKRYYNTYGIEPIVQDGELLLPVELLLTAFKKEGTRNGNEIMAGGISLFAGNNIMLKNGISFQLSATLIEKSGFLYVPVKDVCHIGWDLYCYEDERGFIVISENELSLKNSISSYNVNETSDTIYRMLFFERPSGEKIISKIKSERPRILTDTENLDNVKKLIDSDSRFLRMKEMLLFRADDICLKEPVKRKKIGVRILESARSVATRIETLAIAYMVSNDTMYAERCYKEMENACKWKEDESGEGNWNEYVHFLDSAELGCAMAIGFDSLYGFISDEQKKFIVDKTYENFLSRAIEIYGGNYNGAPWCKSASNWAFVCAGSVLCASLSFAGCGFDEYEYDYRFLLSQAIHSLEYPMAGFYPDGIWVEGSDYWDYATLYLCKGALAPLLFSCGETFSLSSATGLEKTLSSLDMIQSGAGGGFNYADSSTDKQAGAQGYLLARFSGNKSLADAWYERRNSIITVTDKGWASGLELLWYAPSGVESSFNCGNDAYFRGSGIGVMKSGNKTSDTYVGIKGGECNHLYHAHMDLGSFIFSDEGKRFAIDLGADNYDIEGGCWGYYGYTLYRKRPEGHNCIVINPRKDIAEKYYGGQLVDTYATLCENGFKSSFSSAYMKVDLSAPYALDTSEYIRGFYLGDDRNSLTVQDEFTLIEDNSEIYWFMHTKATIDIDDDKKGAKLTLGDKTLYVRALCSVDNWYFEKRDAAPFEGISPERPEQNTNEGISKLTLVAHGSGKITISVKMMCKDFSYDNLFPMSLWEVQVPEGNEAKIKFSNIDDDAVFHYGGENVVSFETSENIVSAKLLIDNSPILETHVNYFNISDYDIKSGKHDIAIKGVNDSGEEFYSETLSVTFAHYEERDTENKTSLDFDNCIVGMGTPSEIKVAQGGYYSINLNSAQCGIIQRDSGGKALKIINSKPLKEEKPYLRVIHGLYTGLGSVSTIKNRRILVEFDTLASSCLSELRFAARSESGDTLFSLYPFTPDGFIGKTKEKYSADTWYKCKVYIDLIGKSYSFYVGNILASSGKIKYNDFQFFDLTVASCLNGESYIAFDNIRVGTYKLQANMLYGKNDLQIINKNVIASFKAYSTAPTKVRFFLCEYSSDMSKLLNVLPISCDVNVGENKIILHEISAARDSVYKMITVYKDKPLQSVCESVISD